MISKMILSSSHLGCSEEIITIAAVLSIQVNPINDLLLKLEQEFQISLHKKRSIIVYRTGYFFVQLYHNTGMWKAYV